MVYNGNKFTFGGIHKMKNELNTYTRPGALFRNTGIGAVSYTHLDVYKRQAKIYAVTIKKLNSLAVHF